MNNTIKIILLSLVVALASSYITATLVLNYSRPRTGAVVTPPANLMQDSDAAVPISNLVTINTSIQKLLDVGGVASFGDVVKAQDSASSTLYIGGQGSNVTYSGCEVMGHSLYGNPVYITVTSSTLNATTTKPAICQ